MSVLFFPQNHSYQSADLSEKIKWTSATSLISKYKNPFNAKEQAIKSSQNKKSKWYKMPVGEILLAWENEKTRAQKLGTWYHNKRETTLLSRDFVEVEGESLQIQRPVFNSEGIKMAPDQRLLPGRLYPEHFVFLKKSGVCGQVDRAEVTTKSILNIKDYKTNKEIDKNSYVNWEGMSKRLLPPLYHLEDCDLIHYSLQLSIYAYIILRHNPWLTLGDLIIEHIIFEEAGRDKFDYPITRLDESGKPILKEIVPYKVQYLKQEVELMFIENTKHL